VAAVLPSIESVRAERARRSLAYFIRAGWHVLEPGTTLEWNWHHDALCDHLQALFMDWMGHQRDPSFVQRFRNFLANVPPGTMKSRIVSVYFPAWAWLIWPPWRAIFLSSNPRVALRDSVACRDVIRSSWYQDTFRPRWRLSDDQDAKSLFKNTEGGFRQAMGFSARITGDRADALVWDDPHDAEEVMSRVSREAVLERWDSAIGNRVNDLRSSVRIGIMQRLHEEDLAGHVLGHGGWEHLRLPMEFEMPSPCKCESCTRGSVIGWKDPRTTPGELLHPARFPRDVLAAELTRLKAYGYAGQMQQRPAPAKGAFFSRDWWKFWCHASDPIEGCVPLPSEFDEQLQSWDLTFKGTSTSDFVTGQVWGRKLADRFLLDQVRGQLSFTATKTAFRTLTAKWPKAARKLVEDKANGPAIIDELRREIGGIVPVEPEGGKEARAHAAAPYVEAGNVYLPHPRIAPWVHDFIEEHASFPKGANDDQVDAHTQAAVRMSARKASPADRYAAAAANG
jgi:predicted phage terminase large subunit-like protein